VKTSFVGRILVVVFFLGCGNPDAPPGPGSTPNNGGQGANPGTTPSGGSGSSTKQSSSNVQGGGTQGTGSSQNK
jgi:hypothetical protein